jgi:hypothetical protein
MLPLFGLVIAGASTALSAAGQAALIGGSIGAAATAIGSNVLKPKNKTRNVDTDDGVTDEVFREAMIEALKIVKKRYDI